MKVPMYTLQLVRSAQANYKAVKIENTTLARQFVADAMGFLANKPQEEVWVVTLDLKHKPIGLHHVTTGTVDSSLVHPREVFKHAFLVNASAILLVHNHPSGDPTPSRQDHEVTRKIKSCGELLGISCLDHLIVGINDDGSARALSIADNN